MGALLSLLSKNTQFGFLKLNGGVIMDIELVGSIKHTYITDLSKEEGVLIATTDNIKNMPVSISMTCRISNNPVSLQANLQGVVSSVLPSNPLAQEFVGKEIIKYSNTLLKNSTNRKQTAFDILIELRNKKALFNVVTGLKVYKNMFFNSITIEENVQAENCLVFFVEMEKLSLKSKSEIGQTKSGLQKIKEIFNGDTSLLRKVTDFTGITL